MQNLINKIKETLKENYQPLLAAILTAVVAVILANLMYQTKDVKKRGFEIAVSEDGKKIVTETKVIDLATALKTADALRGEKIFKKCASCHTIKKGDPSRVGPNLFGIVNRKKAGFAGFSYSQAMSAKGGSWDIESINQFIENPKNYLPGTKMAFGGLKKPQDRADIILYLQQQK